MQREAELMRLGSQHHAVITLDQALAHGLTIGEVRWRLRTGRWFTFFPGVFGIAGAPPTYDQRVMAAALAVEPVRAASHLTAALVWGLALPEPDAVDILTPPGRSVRLEGVRHHRTKVLDPVDLATVRGIPVTTVARKLHDCSKLVTPGKLGWAVDDAQRRKLLRLTALRECHERLHLGPGRRPTAAMHEVLAKRAAGYDPGGSAWELWVLDALAAAGLPLPVQQHRVDIGRDTFRLDLAYPVDKIDIEYDGWDTHSTFTAFHRDRRRRRLLVGEGWRIFEVTSETRAPDVVGTTARLLGIALAS